MPRRFVPSLALAAVLTAVLSIARPLAAQELHALDGTSLHGAWLVPTDSPRTAVTLVVLAGERDNAGEPGLAHYAEHLVWLSAIDEKARAGGRHSNASTTLTLTSYRLDGAGEELGDMLGSLARVFEPIELPEPFMREEIGVVQREYDLRVRESSWWTLQEERARLQHGDEWPGRSVIGTLGSISRLTPVAASEWHARTHRPGNAVLLVHGDHEPDAVNALLRTGFPGTGDSDEPARPEGAATGSEGASAVSASVPGAPIESPPYRMPPPAREMRELVEPRLGEPAILHSRLARFDRLVEPAVLGARLDVLWAVLDSTRPGGLAGPLRFDDFVARGFDLAFFAFEGRHVELLFGASPDAGVDNRTLLERFESVLLGSAESGIPPETFERVRARLLDDIDETDEPDAAVLGLAFDMIAQGASPLSLPDYRDRLAAVTLEETNALLRTLADAPRVVTLLVEPETNP